MKDNVPLERPSRQAAGNARRTGKSKADAGAALNRQWRLKQQLDAQRGLAARDLSPEFPRNLKQNR